MNARDVLLLVVGMLCAVLIGCALLLFPVIAHDNMSKYTPQQQQWLREQSSPLAANCCNEADGDFSEEEIRYENGEANYWTRSAKSAGVWHKVPTEALIRGPNKIGSPIVWWGQTYDEQSGQTYLSVRCYAPGSGL